MKTWLQDDILVKADRMSMASSLEVRSPFLDHRLLEFCARLDGPAKIKASRQKVILKDAMKGTLPSRILSRTKRGFNAPTRHFGAENLAQASAHRALFKTGFALDPKLEDISYKSFAFATLGHWLNMYEHYEKTGQWRINSDGFN
jgi:asparagine synthase (glutamine-hydrolysing)